MGPLLDTHGTKNKSLCWMVKNKQTNKKEIIHFPKIEYPCSRTRSIHLANSFFVSCDSIRSCEYSYYSPHTCHRFRANSMVLYSYLITLQGFHTSRRESCSSPWISVSARKTINGLSSCGQGPETCTTARELAPSSRRTVETL